MKFPIQPVDVLPGGVLRFRQNKLVAYLLEHGGIDMNHLAVVPFPAEDRQQFAQLIGYSISGYGDLSYVDAAAFNAAMAAVPEQPWSPAAWWCERWRDISTPPDVAGVYLVGNVAEQISGQARWMPRKKVWKFPSAALSFEPDVWTVMPKPSRP